MTIALVERGRRAVYHALSLVLTDPATLRRAYDVWEQRFADPHGFRVTLYVTTLAKGQLLEEYNVRALASALYAAMTLPEEKLPQLPTEVRTRRVEPVVAAAPKASVAQSRSVNAHLAIFSSLMAALIESVRRMRKLEQFVAALQAQQPVVSPATLRARAVWIEELLANLQQFAANVPQSERRSVLNDLYLALCAVCGRADADAVLVIAVRATEQVAESHGSTWQQLSRS
jgi:hypothetical protein